jgi:hypothetical protein
MSPFGHRSNKKTGKGLPEIIAFIVERGMLPARQLTPADAGRA